MTTEASEPQKTSGPIKLYLGALVFAFLTLAVLTPTLSGREMAR